jgi:homocysteine S-methyltransferase
MQESPFTAFLSDQGFVVLDGGLATALEAGGYALDTELWSAKLVLDAPDAVRAVHRAYLEAGADCITSAGYQATLEGFRRAGLGEAEALAALRRPVELAAQERDAFWSDPASRVGRLRPVVAASAGPYGAYLADGSEYRGRYGVERGVLARFHGPRLEVLASSGADVIALETIPSLEEAEVLAQLLSEIDHPGAWISFSCRDGRRLRDGTLVADAARAATRARGVIGIGVNCTHPRFVARLLREIGGVTELPLLAYPNSGETYDTAARAWKGSPAGAEWLAALPDWLAAGARVVGGCCRVGPEVIRALRRRLEQELR